jgi:hypothetical protein
LLDRHAVSVRPFGLETAGEAVTEGFHFIGYRFQSERDRQDVKRWWLRHQSAGAAGQRVQAPGATRRPPPSSDDPFGR